MNCNQFLKNLRQMAIGRRVGWRLLLWGLCLVFCWWSLAYLSGVRREERERAFYGGWTIREWIDQALGETYYSAHWVTYEDPEAGKFDQEVIAIGAPAVPELVARLRKLRTGKIQWSLIRLRLKLAPRSIHLPPDISGDAAHINYLLSNMGEAARPAIPAMLDSTSGMHAWAYYDLLADLVRLGPVGRDALPRLRQWAQSGSEDVALAVKLIEKGVTEVNYFELEQRKEDREAPKK